MKKSQNIIEFTKRKREMDSKFAILVHSELMMELINGEVDPKVVYEILTEKGKTSVTQRM